MRQLSPEGKQVVNDLSQQHGFSQDAVTHMLFSVLNGNGSMAQFNHPEFAGSGQWMQGGMMMLGDMFNHMLKSRVDSLCQDISRLLAGQPGLLQSGGFQSQSQSAGGQQQQATDAPLGPSSLFVPDPAEKWWSSDLGTPSATGNQNNVRYAYFANNRRLVVNAGGQVWVYDTLNHQIGGFSQQQGSGSSITFSSQLGTVNLASLPVVSREGQPVQEAPSGSPHTGSLHTDSSLAGAPQTGSPQASSPVGQSATVPPIAGDVFTALERLGELRDKGIVTEDEFNKKKAELLSRM